MGSKTNKLGIHRHLIRIGPIGLSYCIYWVIAAAAAADINVFLINCPVYYFNSTILFLQTHVPR